MDARSRPYQTLVSDMQCTFMDFVPKCLEEKGLLFGTTPKYEPFSVIFERANLWLKHNPQWKVLSCESAESKLKYSGHAQANTSKSTYTVDKDDKTYYIRYFRLWVCNKTSADSPEPQQLRYFNVVPQCTVRGDLWSKPEFENLSQTIERLNSQLKRSPMGGRIINMETQNMKFSTWSKSVSPDTSCWQESGEKKVYFLMVLRVFLDVRVGDVNHIDIADFVPRNLQETFSETMSKVSAWIAGKPANLNVCNVQSVEYKRKDQSQGIDTNRPLYCEHGNRKTHFIRIIRVYYSQSSNVDRVQPQRLPRVTSKTFMPKMICPGTGFGVGEYENQIKTLETMKSWINATGAKVMSCETIKVRLLDKHQKGNPEVMHGTATDIGLSRKCFVHGLRLYLDGYLPDPLMPVTAQKVPTETSTSDDDCCVIL